VTADTNGSHRPSKAELTGDRAHPPAMMPVISSLIPQMLRDLDRWVAWRWEPSGEKWTKVPIQARTGGKAKSNDPTTWSDFATALAFHERGRAAGVGFTLGDGIVGIDLDDCRDLRTGELDAWAEQIVREIDSYTEVSPTGTGVKLFLKGNLPRSFAKNHIEVYSDGRYFACTGNKLDTAPAECNERQTQLDALLSVLQEGKQAAQRNGQHHPQASTPNRDRALALEALRHLAPWRCDDYTAWIEVGQALHAVGEDLLPVWDQWSQGSAKYVPGECAEKWRTFHADRGLTLGSLLYWARKDSGWFPAGWKEPSQAGAANPARERIQIGDFVFALDSARRTPTKVIAEIEVRNATGPIDRITLTSAAASRKDFIQAVRRLVGDHPGVDDMPGRFLAAAALLAQVKVPRIGPTIRQIVMEKVPPAFCLAYRTEKGAWSESRACEITRADFTGFTPGWLIELAKNAADFQGEDEIPDEVVVLRAVEAALKIVWATLISELPRMESADLVKDSEAAKGFRSAVIKLWSRPFAGESITRENGEQVNLRASLRSRVASQLKRPHSGKPAWNQIHPAYSAWWREESDENGEVQTYLAMRYELASEGQVDVSGCDSQAALTALGVKFGAIDPSPPVSTRLSKGSARLAVLSRELTDYLLAEPVEGDIEGDAECHPASPGVTQPDGFSTGEHEK